jgi:hypothetical protein
MLTRGTLLFNLLTVRIDHLPKTIRVTGLETGKGDCLTLGSLSTGQQINLNQQFQVATF